MDKSVVVLAHELRVARAYGAAYVNVHVGSHRGEGVEAGIARLAEGLVQVRELAGDEWRDVTLVLENGSGGGYGLGSTIEELALIEEAATGAGIERDRFGYCLDTAHLWGAGYAIDTADGRRRRPRDVRRGARASGACAWSTSTTRARSWGRARTATSTWARDGSGRRASRGCSATRASQHVAYFLETPGHGGRLRRDQRRPGARSRGRPAARAAPARGVPHAEREGPQRPARVGRRRLGRSRPPRRASSGRAADPARALVGPDRDPRDRRDHAPAGPGCPGPVGRGPGQRHARARRWSATARSRSWARRRRSGRSTTAPLYYYLLAPAAFALGRGSRRRDGLDRAVRHRRGRGDVVAGASRSAAAGRARRRAARRPSRPPAIDESTFIWNPNLDPARVGARVRSARCARGTRRLDALVAARGVRARWSRCSATCWGSSSLPPLVGRVPGRPSRDGRRSGESRRSDGPGRRGAVGDPRGSATSRCWPTSSTNDFSETRAILELPARAAGGRPSAACSNASSWSGLRSVTWPFDRR